MGKFKVLITGISGFIGKSLVEEILNQNLNWDIYGFDIKEPNFKIKNTNDKITFSFVDIRDEQQVINYFNNNTFDGVIHLAAISRVVDAELDPNNCVKTNYWGTKYIVDQVKKTNAWMILGSSREVYGEQTHFPVKESAEKKPLNIYGECKLKDEILVKDNIKKYTILRFSNVYGNSYDIQGRVIPNFVNRSINGDTLYLEGGNQIIDFTYIGDTVNAILLVADKLNQNIITQEEIHICPGYTNKIIDIINNLEKFLNKKINVEVREKRNYDVVQFIGDTTHREEILGRNHLKTLEEGLKIMLTERGFTL